MPWDNPNPEKPIASINVVGALTDAQLVLLAVTFGSENDPLTHTVAAWDCGSWTEGAVKATLSGVGPLRGQGELTPIDERSGLLISGGQSLSGQLKNGPLAEGKPFAIEMEVAPTGKPGGALGGLISAGAYQQSGLRLMLTQELKPTVEIFSGHGPENAKYLVGREPLKTGSFSVLRVEFDGHQAKLLVNGALQHVVSSPLPAPWQGEMLVGKAGGKDYFFNGALGKISIQELLSIKQETP